MNPGLRPYAEPGFGRLTPTADLDQFRDNWWCPDPQRFLGGFAMENFQPGAPLLLLYGGGEPRAAFFTAAQQAQAQRERDALAALPPAPVVLGRWVLAFARANPGDPRVPEALHLVVRSTRYGPEPLPPSANEPVRRISREAFQYLHQHYPGSPWTRRTPYWF